MSHVQQFLQRLESYAADFCLEGDGVCYTYSQLLEEMRLWSSRFDSLNLGRGVVGLRCDYSMSAVAALLALVKRRAVVALIPRDQDAKFYLSEARAAAFLEIGTAGTYEWQEIGQNPSHELLDALYATGDGGMVIFTSGSTGRPKAALQRYERFLYKFRRPGRKFRTLAFLLFDHVAGMDTLFYTLSSGGTLVCTRRRDPVSIAEVVKSHAVEVLPASPSFLRMLCASDEACNSSDLGSLKVITYGAEPMDPTTLARLNQRFPNAQISQKYGTTETGSPRSVSRASDSLWLKIKSDDVETKVVNGVLWIRSPSTILGYLNAPSPVDNEGWYCTGDLVDTDGEWLRFRGRESDLIIVGGEKVAPSEVEQSILELDFVREAVVTGEPHALMGQVVTAQVVIDRYDADPKVIAREIRTHCRQRLASFKVPVKIAIGTKALSNNRHKTQRSRKLSSD